MVESELSNYQKMYLEERRIKHVIETRSRISCTCSGTRTGENRSSGSPGSSSTAFMKDCPGWIEAVEEQFGVSAEYAPLLLPSAVIYKKFLEMTGAEAIWIPGTGLCDGIAAEYALDKES